MGFMKAIKFKGYNTIFAKDQEQYIPLPAHVDNQNGLVSTCWKMGFTDRIKILFIGKIFLQVLTFKRPLQPLKMLTHNPIKDERKSPRRIRNDYLL